MTYRPPEDAPSRLDDADAQPREGAMLVIWALLGLLVTVLFSLALWS